MSFKDSYYKCFSCDVGGDVISLTQKLFNLTPIEAVKKLSDDFGLGLDLKNDNSVDVSVIEGKRQNKELLVVFQDWIDKTSSDYSKLARYYWQNIQKNKPLTENDPLHPLYVQGIHQWERINYLLDILLKGTIEEKVGLYRSLNNMKGVKKIND